MVLHGVKERLNRASDGLKEAGERRLKSGFIRDPIRDSKKFKRGIKRGSKRCYSGPKRHK